MRAALALLWRELLLACREGGAIGTALGFYLMVVAITPLGLGQTSISSRASRPASCGWRFCWRACSPPTACSTATTRTARSTCSAMGPLPLAVVAGIKSFAHWLTTGVPLALLAPVLGLLLNLPANAYPFLVLAMLAGTPAVSFIAGIGASLTLGLKRSGMLLALLVLPLYVPVLIFGVAAVSAATTGPASPWPPFLMLCALSLASLVLAPIAAAAALRAAMR